VEHWLAGHPGVFPGPARFLLLRRGRGGRGPGGRVTLLGPEETGACACFFLRSAAVSSVVRGAGGGAVRFLRTAQWTRASCICSCQVFKGTRWMPWHQEPMKDAGACDMPRGAGNQAVIRGFPNGETWRVLWPVASA
jgi:hypothetical protein